MRIVKPLRLGMLTRPFTNDQRRWLAVTVIAMTDGLGRDARLIPEPHCWQTFADEFGQGAAFDLSMPKSSPEFLVSGNAYTRHQEDKTRCAVRVRVGAVQKDLMVFGERFWVDGRASEPQGFESLRLDWQHAYGGPSFEENPIGIGAEEETVNGLRVRRLPNVEHPGARLHRPDQSVEPAGLGLVDMARPSRSSRLGSQYDEHWQEHLFPGYAKDMDWRYFNAAPADQWLAPGEAGVAGADFEIWNMHPEHAVLRGEVPRWRARCVVVRGPINGLSLAEGTLDDVPMRLDTAWFFPHLERIGLIYHGLIPVREDDAADITHAMIALEDGATPPKGLDAYRDLMALRCESEDRALYGLFDEHLMPEAAIAPWPELDAPFEDSPMRVNMKARADREMAEMREAFKSKGLDPEGRISAEFPAQKVPTLRELPAFIQQTRAEIEAQRKKAEEVRAALAEAGRANAEQSRKVGFDTSKIFERVGEARLKGPPKDDHMPRIEAMARGPASAGFAPSPEQMAQMRRMIEQAQDSLLESYRRTAQMQDAADCMTPEQSSEARATVARILAGTRDLSGLDLTGADLSNMDLRNARWHRTLLECVDLSGSVLDGGDMQHAVLVRAALDRTSLRDVNFTASNLALARCSDADFTGARFHETLLEAMSADGCNFSSVSMEGLDFADASLLRCDFSRARLSVVNFDEGSVLRDVLFAGATLHKVAWIESTVSGLRFPHADLDTCDWTETDCSEGVDFSDATLRSTCFVDGSHLRGAGFQGATLIDCNLQQAELDGVDFRDARLANTDFSDASMRGAKLAGANADGATFVRTDLTGASFVDASLMEADLQKSILVAADFHRANLFQADLSQCLIDDTTRFDEAYTEQVITHPKRKAQEAAS
jgi:uncharacterized protein YjbI with pentapeptide repeats